MTTYDVFLSPPRESLDLTTRRHVMLTDLEPTARDWPETLYDSVTPVTHRYNRPTRGPS